jgi:hypothetical protein
MDDDVPKIHRYRLKPKEIIPTDQVARTGDGTAISVPLIHKENQLAAERPLPESAEEPANVPAEEDEFTGASDLFRPRVQVGEEERAKTAEELEISVHEFLKENSAAESKFRKALVMMSAPGIPRRHRDFGVVAVLLALAFGVFALVFREDPRIVSLGLWCVIFLAGVFAYIIYGIMDKY